MPRANCAKFSRNARGQAGEGHGDQGNCGDVFARAGLGPLASRAAHVRLPNLFLAGDWTATGWPATMEGAVRSGYLAAEAILSDAGTPRKFLQPDLRAEGFARLWASGS